MADESTAEQSKEPADSYVYRWVMFDRETLAFFLKAVRFYDSRVADDIKAVRDDPELTELLDPEALESYPIGREIERTKRVGGWIEAHLAKINTTRPWVDISISHETVRFVKSVEIMYLEHLRRKSNNVAARSGTSKGILEALDQQIAKIAERINAGVFRAATPYPLLLNNCRLSRLASLTQRRRPMLWQQHKPVLRRSG